MRHRAHAQAMLGISHLSRVVAPVLLPSIEVRSDNVYAMLLLAVLVVLGESHRCHRIAHRRWKIVVVAYPKKRVQGAGGSACHCGPVALDERQPGRVTERHGLVRLLCLVQHSLSRNHLLPEHGVRSEDQATEQCRGRGGRESTRRRHCGRVGRTDEPPLTQAAPWEPSLRPRVVLAGSAQA